MSNSNILKVFAIHFAGMHKAIYELSDSDLMELRDACKGVSSASSWWAEYEAGTFLSQKVEDAILFRQRRAAKTQAVLHAALTEEAK